MQLNKKMRMFRDASDRVARIADDVYETTYNDVANRGGDDYEAWTTATSRTVYFDAAAGLMYMAAINLNGRTAQ